jgi:hypothetical protein
MNNYFSEDKIFNYKINYYYDNNNQKYIIASNNNINITIIYKILGSYNIKKKIWIWGSDMTNIQKDILYDKNELEIDNKYIKKKYFKIEENNLNIILKSLKNINIIADKRLDNIFFIVVENILKIIVN